jgi:hypothetical protein
VATSAARHSQPRTAPNSIEAWRRASLRRIAFELVINAAPRYFVRKLMFSPILTPRTGSRTSYFLHGKAVESAPIVSSVALYVHCSG